MKNTKTQFDNDNVYDHWNFVFGFGPWKWPKEIDERNNPNSTFNIIGRSFVETVNAEIIENVPEENRNVVVQCGGHAGIYPFLLSNMFKKVYTFEPDPINFHCLVNNCQRENIVKIQAALSNKVGHQQFEKTRGNTGQHRLAGENAWPKLKPINTFDVLTLTVDSLFIEHLDMLIIDAEGYSSNIIEGAKETLKRSNTFVLFEKHWDPERIKDEKKLMESIGYVMHRETGTDAYYKNKTQTGVK